jgi:hypothetical protein
MMLIVSFNDEFAPYAGKNGGQNLVNLAVHRLSDALPTGSCMEAVAAPSKCAFERPLDFLERCETRYRASLTRLPALRDGRCIHS